jgi:D-3-phosphoglycerate dehydrogenase
MVTLDELLIESDFITIHLPKTPETIGLIGDAELHKTKPTVHIINAARGGIIDETALYNAIVDGRVAGAGVDVYSKEPCTDSPLFSLESVVATPHLGASTDEAQEKAGISVARSVRLALAGELVPDAVNVQGGNLHEDIKPLIPLAEMLGVIACALADSAIVRVEVEVRGAVVEHDVRVLELSATKGIFQNLVHDPVSFVNAPVLAEQRGVDISLKTERISDDHKNLVSVSVTQTDGEVVCVSGTVAGSRNHAKVVNINGFDIDVPISSHMAFFRYHDRPGVIGQVGNLLGNAEINIAGMQVSRDNDGNALIALTVDSPIAPVLLDQITGEIGAHAGKSVAL